MEEQVREKELNPLTLGKTPFLSLNPAPPEAASQQEPACQSSSGACKSTAQVARSEESSGSG